MLKYHRALEELETAIQGAVDDALRTMYESTPTLRGREEEFTAGLRYEFNGHLLDRIRSRLDGRAVHGLKFTVETFTKKQERDVGADLASVVSLTLDGMNVTKVFLAQAKIARETAAGLVSANPDTLRQARDMLRLTSASFFWLYAPNQVLVVPAASVALAATNTIYLDQHYFHPLRWLYGEFFKCFIGDAKLPSVMKTPQDLADYARTLPAPLVQLLRADA
jgi:hypothetical protein